jgi:hypothetical protein
MIAGPGDYLIPRDAWIAEREQHDAALGLPIDSGTCLTPLESGCPRRG